MINLGEIIGVIGGFLGIIALLARIAWTMGQLVQRFGDHVTQADKIHGDQEKRIRDLERRGGAKGRWP